MGRQAVSNRRLNGTEFIAVEVPAAHTGTVVFHPTDPQQAFLLVSCRGDPIVQVSNCSGWWRTRDEGETWQFMKSSSATRAFRRVLAVEPQTGVMFVTNPINRTIGIEVSVDDGATWSPFALQGFHIWDLVVRAQPRTQFDESKKSGATELQYSLFVVLWEDARINVNQQPSVSGGPLVHFQGTITRDSESNKTTVGWSTKSQLVQDHVNDFAVLQAPSPSTGSLAGRAIISNSSVQGFECVPQRNPYTACGSLNRTVLFPRPGGLPARAVHALEQSPHDDEVLVAYSMAQLKDKSFLVSMDGGDSWRDWTGHMGSNASYIANFIDYGPANYKTPGYHYPNASEQNQQDRKLIYFPPPAPGALAADQNKSKDPPIMRAWMTNFLKAPLESTDGGMNWRPFAHGGVFKQAVQMSFGQSDDVIAVGRREYGLDLTVDGGLSWKGLTIYNQPEWPSHEHPPHGIPYWQIRAQWGVQFHPTNDSILLTSYGVAPVLIVRSEDRGESWTVVGNFTVEEDALADGKLFWGSTTAPRSDEGDARVSGTGTPGCTPDSTIVYASYMRSTDGGCTFEPTPSVTLGRDGKGAATRVRASSIHPLDARVVLSKMAGDQLLLSADSGNTWSVLAAPPSRPAPEDALAVINNVRFAGMEAFDPRPQHNPATGGSVRLLVGGMYGVWEFAAASGTAHRSGTRAAGGALASAGTLPGSWRLLDNSTFRADPRLGFAELGYIAFNVRAGGSGRGGVPPNGGDDGGVLEVAALGSYVPLADVHLQRGDQRNDAQYASEDGGESWIDVSAAAFEAKGIESELPHHASCNVPPAWSPTSGEIHMSDFSGVYALRRASNE